MLCRLWDAVADPIIGFWSDRTKSRLGRRRPWMLGAIPVLALTFIMVWLTPLELDETLRIAWVCVALFAFYSAHTAYMVPYQALGAELTRNHHDRSRIFGAWYAAFTAGTLVAFGGMQYVMTAEDSSCGDRNPGHRPGGAAGVGHAGAPHRLAGTRRASGPWCVQPVTGAT